MRDRMGEIWFVGEQGMGEKEWRESDQGHVKYGEGGRERGRESEW